MAHAIEVEAETKPPHHPMYQLSSAEQKDAKDYIEDLLKKGKIRRSKSPYGVPLSFVKDLRGLRIDVDYRALIRITKRNNAPISRPDEMFVRIEG